MGASKPRRWPGRVAVAVPALLLVLSVVAAIWGFAVIHSTFGNATFLQQINATMVMFAGGYLALDQPHDPIPPPGLAIPAVMAFGVTIAAAGTVVVTLSSKARNVVRALTARPHLIVVGSGATAAAIIRSCQEKGVKALLITESRDSDAARACLHLIPVVTTGSLAESGSFGVSRRVLKRGANVVIATDSDAGNLELRRHVTRAVGSAVGGRRSVVAVVNDAALVEAMRPKRIRELVDVDVTCPAENIAEHVCLLVDAAATGPAAIARIPKPQPDTEWSDPESEFWPTDSLVDRIVVSIVAGGPDNDIADTIHLWLVRQAWGRKFLFGDEEPGSGRRNPVIPIAVNDTPTARDLVIKVYCGGAGSAVVQSLLADRLDLGIRPADLTIVVADEQLVTTAADTFDQIDVQSGWAWLTAKAPLARTCRGRSTFLVVDPSRVGLDANLVADDVRLQWARVFDQTYRFMFAGDYAIDGWLPGAPLGSGTAAAEATAIAAIPANERTPDAIARERRKARKQISDRHSSEAAVQNMIRYLQIKGWAVIRYDGDQAPPEPLISDDDVGAIAEMEHESWRKRGWWDTSPERGILWRRNKYRNCAYYSNKKLGEFSWDRLVEKAESDDPPTANEFTRTVKYNKRIVTETYPAIAARFGYRLVYAPEDEQR